MSQTLSPLIANPIAACAASLPAAEALLLAAREAVRALLSVKGAVSADLLEQNQFQAHGLAWMATYVESLREMHGWATRLQTEGRFGELEALILQAAFGEYLSQMAGGIAMNQGEVVRPQDMGVTQAQLTAFFTDAVNVLIRTGNTAAVRERIAQLISDNSGAITFGNTGLDETHTMIREQFHRFAEERVAPFAHDWHMKNELIPIEVVNQMGELGVFGLTIPEQLGGLGLGKMAMCVVSEELSRGYIGVGSLGTRSEIAAELIMGSGTDAQKSYYLPKLASAEILPTAVFTEPNTGSDLATLRTRAVKDGDVYKITGNKTWITHASRTDMMTLLVRTDPLEPGYKGLSMFLAEKPRGADDNLFPAQGMTGGEIEVLGYRGMKEYELAFDGFEVPAKNLLGEKEGEGFKSLMKTFESARIQTAARAIGVAQCALELGLKYGQERLQFGKPIYSFPRVSGKIAWMAVEIMIARQLTYYSARRKDDGLRCDLEAGMAKLLGARIAWMCADNALQIHGGNGFALEYPISRVLCDARILNIFEGAGEIQAQVITRRLLEE
ncbi:MAG: acyl-CoA dehydrogenase family protein [Pseudomonadota bacterium]